MVIVEREGMNMKRKKILLLVGILLMSAFALTACGDDDDCGMCNGSGYYQKKTCPVCNGSGHSDYDPYEQLDEMYD